MPWAKQTASAVMLDGLEKRRSGIIGYLASFHSLMKKRTRVMTPNTSRQTTVAEDQGKDTPPYSRPRRNMTVPPVTRTTPSQSMAFRPSRIGVLGISMSRKTKMMAKAIASKGTEKTSAGSETRYQRQMVTYDLCRSTSATRLSR